MKLHVKNPNKPNCIDPIMKNRPNNFQKSGMFKTGLLDFHKLPFAVLKVLLKKQKPRVLSYNKYNFSANITVNSFLPN